MIQLLIGDVRLLLLRCPATKISWKTREQIEFAEKVQKVQKENSTLGYRLVASHYKSSAFMRSRLLPIQSLSGIIMDNLQTVGVTWKKTVKHCQETEDGLSIGGVRYWRLRLLIVAYRGGQGPGFLLERQPRLRLRASSNRSQKLSESRNSEIVLLLLLFV